VVRIKNTESNSSPGRWLIWQAVHADGSCRWKMEYCCVANKKTLADNLPRGLRPFFKSNEYQYRVLAIGLALLFLMAPAMISGGLVLYQIFISPNPEIPHDASGNVLVATAMDLFVPRVVIIGIFFCLGLFIILYATRGFPDLENVLVGISFMAVSTGAGLCTVVSHGCLNDLKCDDFAYYAGLFCILGLTLLGFILSRGIGKPIGWFAFLFAPVVFYEVIYWSYYLFSDNQQFRTTPGVMKATLILLVTFALAALFALAGGWGNQQKR
jgi:hypothetical protein